MIRPRFGTDLTPFLYHDSLDTQPQYASAAGRGTPSGVSASLTSHCSLYRSAGSADGSFEVRAGGPGDLDDEEMQGQSHDDDARDNFTEDNVVSFPSELSTRVSPSGL